MGGNPKKLLVADAHDIIIVGVRSLLEKDFDIVGCVTDGRELIEADRMLKPDLIITAVIFPLGNGIEIARKIRARNPDVKIIFMTGYRNAEYAIAAMSLGNCGYVLKATANEELPIAIEQVLQGRNYVARSMTELMRRAARLGAADRNGLSERQHTILEFVVQGYRSKEIALRMDLSHRTIEYYKSCIMKQLGVRTTASLVRAAIELALVASDC